MAAPQCLSPYPLPEETCPCPCCHPADANALLHAAPLRELQWKHLAGYSAEALMVWGPDQFTRRIIVGVVQDVRYSGAEGQVERQTPPE
jgi:hypothetical protein